MGGKKRGLISIGLLFAVLLSWVGVEAQIVIKETVEIQPKGQTSTSISKSSVVGPGGFYHPVIQRLNKDTYLVLKSGDLKFYFKEAQSYGIERVEDHVLHYAVNGPSTNIVDSVEIADYLNGPIVLKEGADLSCTETQTYFTSDLLYGVDPTDDTYIVHTPPNYPPNANNYGAQSRVLASGHNNPQNHPDAASRTTYLQFGINQIETNAQLNAAYLNLTAVPSSTNPTGSSDPEGHLRLYKVEGPWDEQTLTFANRPSTNLSGVITVTPNDMQEIEGVGYDYTKDITSFVDGRLNNGFPDHGIRISSDSGHVFVSKESIFESASRSSITLDLVSTENADSRILNMGYVQAGDTLHLQYMGLPNALYPLFTDNAVQAEEQLNYGKNSGCQTDNYLVILPHIEEDTAKSPYFEFALHTELNLPSNEQAYTGIYIEPKILFDNGLVRLPGRIFFDYFAELHDVSPVYIPEGTPGLPTGILPVALLDGSPSGWTSFGPYITGTTIQYLSHPLAQGKTFKIVIAGNIRKGIMVGKTNPNAPNAANITKALQNALLEAHPELSAAVANCDINPYGQELEGVFVSCFEFTIGDDAPKITLELPDSSEVWPTIRSIDGGNPDNRNSTSLFVTVTQNEEPVAGHQIKLSTEFIINSGGHDHSVAPPQNRLGVFENIATGALGEGALITYTDENGKLKIKYTATELGGDIAISAQSLSTSTFIKDTINVRVPGLEYLGTSDFFELVGSAQFNSNTTDPCRAPDSFKSLHDLGHYGITEFNSAIKNLARNFFVRNDSTKLRINDMSLENGGVFDTKNHWTPPHAAHRVGIQGDIGIRTILKNGTCNLDQSPDLILSEILNSQQFLNTITYSSHYHVRIK